MKLRGAGKREDAELCFGRGSSMSSLSPLGRRSGESLPGARWFMGV